MLAPAKWESQGLLIPTACYQHHPTPRNPRFFDPMNEMPRVIKDVRSGHEYFMSMYLGKGGFGRCFRAESGRERFAIKIIDKSRLKKDSHWVKIRKEIAIQSRLVHPNILMMHSCFDSPTEIFMILEYCSEGSLLDCTQMAQGRRLSEPEAVGFLYQLMSGVSYLHDKKVLHRDLKPGNLLLDKNGVLKVADFGLACFMDEIDYGRQQSVCGTPNYISPEVLRHCGHSLASEAWAIGCIFYFMLVGIPPFETESLGATYDRIRQGKFYFPSNVFITNYARQLIEQLLDINPETRLLPQKILAHRIFHRSPTAGSMGPRFSKSASNLLVLGSEGHTMLDTHSGKGSATPPHVTSRLLAESSLSRYSSTADIASRGVHSRTDYNGNNLKMLYSDSPPLSDDCVVPTVNNTRYSFTQSLEIYIETLDSLLAGDSRTNMLELREMPRDMLCILCWIDYRNAYGFGCTLNDGTRSLHFNDGCSISQRGQLMGFLPKPTSVLRDPYEWFDTGDEFACPANLRDKRNLLAYTSNYMARELCSTFSENLSDSRLDENRELTYIVSAHQKGEQIIMGLSNGTCQMNDKESHSKYVLGIDDCGGVTLTILSGESTTSYSVHLGAGRKPMQLEANGLRKFRELLATQHRLLIRPNRSICSTDC